MREGGEGAEIFFGGAVSGEKGCVWGKGKKERASRGGRRKRKRKGRGKARGGKARKIEKEKSRGISRDFLILFNLYRIVFI